MRFLGLFFSERHPWNVFPSKTQVFPIFLFYAIQARFHWTGMDGRALSTLCQILCDNALPQFHLSVLKWTFPQRRDVSMCFSDFEFVNVKRCLSRLTRLEYLELDGLTTEQRLELCQAKRFVLHIIRKVFRNGQRLKEATQCQTSILKVD